MQKELDFFYIGDSYGGNQDWCLDHMMQLGGCGAITACDCSIYFKLRMGEEKAYPGKLTEPIFPKEEKTSLDITRTSNVDSEAISEEEASFGDTCDRALPEINLPKPAQVVEGDITMPECPSDAPFYEGPGAALGIDRDTYIRFTEVMKPYLHPRWSGIDKLYLFTEGLARYYEEHGVTDIEMEEFDGGNELPEAIERVKQQINAGYPIPCLILNHRNPAMEDYIWHWFLLVGYQTKEAEPSADEAIQSSTGDLNEEIATRQSNGAIQTDVSDQNVRQDVKVQAIATRSIHGKDKENTMSNHEVQAAATRSTHDFYVKTSTYSEANWVRFADLWNTGYPVKGGLILFHKRAEHAR